MMMSVYVDHTIILEPHHNVFGAVPYQLGRHPLSFFLVILHLQKEGYWFLVVAVGVTGVPLECLPTTMMTLSSSISP